MLQVTSPQLARRCKAVTDALGKTGTRTAQMQCAPSANGLEVIIAGDNWGSIRFYDDTADITTDGTIVLPFGDVIDTLGLTGKWNDPVALTQVDETMVTINALPLYLSTTPLALPNVLGTEYQLTLDETQQFIQLLGELNRHLKKSIFPESLVLTGSFEDKAIQLRTISPLGVHTRELPYQSATKATNEHVFYFNKLSNKIIRTLFKTANLKVIPTAQHTKLTNVNYEFVTPQFTVRRFMYYPSYKPEVNR